MTGAEWTVYRFGENKTSEFVRLLGAAMSDSHRGHDARLPDPERGLFLGMFFPWPPLYTTLVLVTVTTLYTMSSGFYGVVLTDLVQGIIVMASCLIIAFRAWHLVPDSAGLAATAEQVTGNADWTNSHPAWHTPMPAGYEAYSPLIMMMMFYLVRHVLGGLGTGAEARYFGARSDRDSGCNRCCKA